MFNTHNIYLLKRKKEWFLPLSEASYVLWWIPKGHIPTLQEAITKLDHLRENGESQDAFSLKSSYPKPELENH